MVTPATAAEQMALPEVIPSAMSVELQAMPRKNRQARWATRLGGMILGSLGSQNACRVMTHMLVSRQLETAG